MLHTCTHSSLAGNSQNLPILAVLSHGSGRQQALVRHILHTAWTLHACSSPPAILGSLRQPGRGAFNTASTRDPHVVGP